MTNSCAATLVIDAKANVEYLARFTSTDSKIAVYTNVIVVINEGQWNVSGGPVSSGGSIWINLGPCTRIFNYDFVINFLEPGTNIPRTAVPDPPPFPALPPCQDSIVFGDLGGILYP
jgi:hypothetical protein